MLRGALGVGKRDVIELPNGTRLQVLGGPRKAPAVPTFERFAREFLDTYAVVRNKPSEVEAKRVILRVHLTPRFGHLTLAEIDVRACMALQSELLAEKDGKPGLSRKRVNNVCTVLRTILRHAVELGVLDGVPRIPHLRTPTPTTASLTAEEAERLVRCADPEWRCLIVMALHTGMRIGELQALRWDAVDLEAKVLTVRASRWRDQDGTPKGGKARRVPLSASLTDCLREHEKTRCGPYVWTDKGKPHSRHALKWPLWRAADRAGLPRFGWHRLRHTFATLLAERGVPLRVVQDLLGHCTITLTERYAHAAPSQAVAAIELLDGPKRAR